jgi:hypothetical protein
MYYTIDHIRTKRVGALMVAVTLGIVVMIVAVLGGLLNLASAEVPSILPAVEFLVPIIG